MKQNEDNPMQSGATFTEIEYTPIRRKSSDGSGVSVSSDEISVLSTQGEPPSPILEVSLSEVEAEAITEMPVAVEAEQANEESMPEALDEIAELTVPKEFTLEEEAMPLIDNATDEDLSFPETLPSYERVVLPEEISLADVTIIEEPAIESVDEAPAEDATPTEQTQEDGEETFVFTPMPEPIEYERVVLPEEISLVDVLTEIRQGTTPEVEESPEVDEKEETVIAEPQPDTLPPMPEEVTATPAEPENETIENMAYSDEEETIADIPTSEALPAEEPEQEETSLPVVISEAYDSEEASLLPPEVTETEEASEESLPDEDEEQAVNGESDEDAEEIAPAIAAPKKEEPKERPIEGRFDMIELFAFTLAFVLLLTTFFFRSSAVVGSSMEGTLHNGDQLILYAFLYEPKVGDIIVFEDYSTGYREPLVKRVIATEGQTVEIYDAYNVYVDGKRLNEDYIFLDGYDNTSYPIIHTVAEGHIFVMGDHRNASSDSRIFRDVSVETVLGKVLFRYYPFDIFTKFD